MEAAHPQAAGQAVRRTAGRALAGVAGRKGAVLAATHRRRVAARAGDADRRPHGRRRRSAPRQDAAVGGSGFARRDAGAVVQPARRCRRRVGSRAARTGACAVRRPTRYWRGSRGRGRRALRERRALRGQRAHRGRHAFRGRRAFRGRSTFRGRRALRGRSRSSDPGGFDSSSPGQRRPRRYGARRHAAGRLTAGRRTQADPERRPGAGPVQRAGRPVQCPHAGRVRRRRDQDRPAHHLPRPAALLLVPDRGESGQALDGARPQDRGGAGHLLGPAADRRRGGAQLPARRGGAARHRLRERQAAQARHHLPELHRLQWAAAGTVGGVDLVRPRGTGGDRDHAPLRR